MKKQNTNYLLRIYENNDENKWKVPYMTFTNTDSAHFFINDFISKNYIYGINTPGATSKESMGKKTVKVISKDNVLELDESLYATCKEKLELILLKNMIDVLNASDNKSISINANYIDSEIDYMISEEKTYLGDMSKIYLIGLNISLLRNKEIIFIKKLVADYLEDGTQKISPTWDAVDIVSSKEDKKLSLNKLARILTDEVIRNHNDKLSEKQKSPVKQLKMEE